MQNLFYVDVKRSCSWFVIGGFFFFWMPVTIMVDRSIKRSRKFGFILQSSHVIVFNNPALDSVESFDFQNLAHLASRSKRKIQ